ncbi:MAG: hypothetical protein M3N12_09615 [Verrucomicrobiota bacterium]|nr:hypothetical protein [Verrucomicrobiota bacterium]
MTKRPLHFASALLLLLSPAATRSTSGAGINFAGVSVVPGGIARAQVPLNATEQKYVSEGGNPVPSHAVAVIAVPPGFDPQRAWPVLVCLSTSDFSRKNRDDLVELYLQAALAEGWILLAGDGEENPRQDSTGWRAGMTLAALDALHRSFPGSSRWPIAVAGFSGGAKRAGSIAPLLALAGNRLIGIFLTGVNEDRLSQAYQRFQPGAAFLRTPIYISAGQLDEIARMGQQNEVRLAIEKAGFTRVRLVPMQWGHAVSRGAIREALRWFRSQ